MVSCDPYRAPPIALEKALAMAVTNGPVTDEIVHLLDDNTSLSIFIGVGFFIRLLLELGAKQKTHKCLHHT